MDKPRSAINTISRWKRLPHQFYRHGTLSLSPSPITAHLPGDGRGVQDFLFELAKAGLYNLNGKFNFHLQIKEVDAPLFSAAVLYREAFSLQTKGQTTESSRTAISSISLTFGCSDTDRLRVYFISQLVLGNPIFCRSLQGLSSAWSPNPSSV